jgi:predicted DsbA family dithiol-disulfide isomerase
MKIQFVSDIACPWCAIGLASLEQALARIGNSIPVDLHFEPYELNPTMPREGVETVPYLMQKYGRTAEQVAQSRERIRERGAAVGFTFGERTWVWNTFDAHRLLHWAGLEGKQLALKRALLSAYHTRDENPSDASVLKRLCGEAGLDETRASEILASDEFAQAVREREAHFQRLGINGVPAIVLDERHLIEGGQPPEVFERAIRQAAAEAAA